METTKRSIKGKSRDWKRAHGIPLAEVKHVPTVEHLFAELYAMEQW